MKKKDLPNATAVLVLGILSLVFCWCYGFVGLVLGILGVAIASGPRKAYLEHPEEYTDCLLYTSPSPRDRSLSRMPSSA